MPSIYDLKPKFQQLLTPVLTGLHQAGVTANQITWSALWLSFAGGGLIIWAHHAQAPQWLWIIPPLLFVRMALNALDGMMARNYNQQSKTGAVLNELGDVLSDTALYIPLIFWVPMATAPQLAVIAFVFLSQLTEFCGILAQVLIGERRYDGPMGKSDRAFVVSLYCIALNVWPQVAHAALPIFSILAILLMLSCWNRIQPILSSTD